MACASQGVQGRGWSRALRSGPHPTRVCRDPLGRKVGRSFAGGREILSWPVRWCSPGPGVHPRKPQPCQLRERRGSAGNLQSGALNPRLSAAGEEQTWVIWEQVQSDSKGGATRRGGLAFGVYITSLSKKNKSVNKLQDKRKAFQANGRCRFKFVS